MVCQARTPRLPALLAVALLTPLLPALAAAHPDDDYFSMSLAELLEVSVDAGSITGTTLANAPASVTVITAADIAATPGHNLCDLLEVYVPGFTHVSHFNGPRIGMRGILGDQNDSFLLIVDGQNLNLQARGGPAFELLNRDLRDIEAIEIIRGPGSVTYGPGAIGGIINITTRNGRTDPGTVAGVAGNLEYRYGQIDASHGRWKPDYDLHLYGSVNSSRGQDDPEFYYVDRAHGYGYGFMGPDWGDRGLGTDAPPTLADCRGRPQVKLGLELGWREAWRFRARYTSNSWIKQTQARPESPDFMGFNRALLALSLENTTALSSATSIETRLAFSSANDDEVSLYQGAGAPLDALTQKNAYYAENRWLLQSTWHHQTAAGHRFAVGASVEHQSWGAPWGKDDNAFVMSFRAPIRFAVLDSASAFRQQYPDLCTVLDEGLSAHQAAVFCEANLGLGPHTTLLLSGRGDKHEYSEMAWSPRVALMRSFGSNLVKAIWQRSVRLPAFVDLHSQHVLDDTEASPEVLTGLEVIWHRQHSGSLGLDLAVFLNNVEQIAWKEVGYAGLVGSFDLFGLELEGRYQTEQLAAGASYSFIHQLDWETDQPIEAFIVIPGDPDDLSVPLSGYGENRINNLPGHALKGYLRKPLAGGRVIAHLDGRFSWDPGQADMLAMFRQAHDEHGSAATRAEMAAIDADLRSHGYAEPAFTSNVSLAWRLPVGGPEAWATLWARNLVTHNHQRYVIQFWEGGDLRQYPRQAGFVGEPLSVGARVEVRF